MYTFKISDAATLTVSQNDIISPLDADSNLPITLYGKNFREYGQDFQNNLYYLLENFCGEKAPPHPIIGMLWYDNKNDMLKIYTGKDKPNGPWMQVSYEDMPTTTTTAAPTTTTTTEAPTTTTTTEVPTTTTTTEPVVIINYDNIKFGITWGGAIDFDTVIMGYDASGKCTYFNTTTAKSNIDGIAYSGDITSGGQEEWYNITLTKMPYTTLVLGIIEWTANSFNNMTSLNTRIVNLADNTNIAEFTLNTIVKDITLYGTNATCIVGAFTHTPTGWTFKSYQKLVKAKSGKYATVLGDNLSDLGLS